MGLYTEWIEYGKNKEYKGYLARMDKAKMGTPSIIVIQEIFGVDEYIQDVTNRFAQAGYIAFAPDLFSHLKLEELRSSRLKEVKNFSNSIPPETWGNPEKRLNALKLIHPELSQRVTGTLSKIFGELKPDFYMKQLLETSSYLKNQYEYSQGQKLVSVGFCLGGFLSALLASENSELSCAVIVYGKTLQKEKIENIQCPVLGIYGALDDAITNTIPDFAVWMREANKSFEYEIYEGAHHGFFNDTRNSYEGDASRHAFSRILQFLDQSTVSE